MFKGALCNTEKYILVRRESSSLKDEKDKYFLVCFITSLLSNQISNIKRV